MSDDRVESDFLTRWREVEKIVRKFHEHRAGRRPYEARGACPECRKAGREGTVKFWYGGPRAVRMSCDNPECGVRMMG